MEDWTAGYNSRNRSFSVMNLLLLVPIGLLAPAAHAQTDFTLFEPVDAPAQEQQAAANARVGREARNATGSGTPEFTLVGTSRIGDRFGAILAHRDGRTVTLNSEDGMALKDFPGVSVAEIQSGRVVLNLPGGMPCVESPDQGVTCASPSVAELTLPNRAPIAKAVPVPAEAEVAVEGDVVPPDANNPFAALQEAARRGQIGTPGDPPGQPFQARRINPADVPPGMRIVSTPFGDRLVEDN